MAEKKQGNDTFNVTSNNQTGGYTAGQINFGAPQRVVDEQVAEWLLSNVPRSGPPVEISAIAGDAESYMFARAIDGFLRMNGYNVRGIGQATYSPPMFGLQLDPRSEWTNLVVGHRTQ